MFTSYDHGRPMKPMRLQCQRLLRKTPSMAVAKTPTSTRFTCSTSIKQTQRLAFPMVTSTS